MDERKLTPTPASDAPPTGASAPLPPHPARRRRSTLARSFYYAFSGLVYLFATQRNARIELIIGIIVCALAAWLRVGRTEFAILAIMIALVLILEGLNTALEAAVDLASPQIHPLAKIAKDVSAGMVLIAAIASVVVGLLILGPPLVARATSP